MIEPLIIIPVGLVVVILGYIAHKKRWKIVDFL